MTEERWKDIVGNIKEKFSVLDEGSEHIDDEGGVDVEFIEFDGPLGRMRLEFISRPIVLDKKTTYSRRIGSQTDIKYIYSEDERSFTLKAYKKDEAGDDWSEIEAKNFE